MNSALLSCHLELEDEEDFVFGELIKRVCSEPLFLLGSTECEVSSFWQVIQLLFKSDFWRERLWYAVPCSWLQLQVLTKKICSLLNWLVRWPTCYTLKGVPLWVWAVLITNSKILFLSCLDQRYPFSLCTSPGHPRCACSDCRNRQWYILNKELVVAFFFLPSKNIYKTTKILVLLGAVQSAR